MGCYVRSPPLSPTGARKTFCDGQPVQNTAFPLIEGCVRYQRMTFFFEMLASTKSFSGPDEKIVRFLGCTLFLHVNSAFSALERKTTIFSLFLCVHGDGRLAVPEGTTLPPKLTPPPNHPKMMFLDQPHPKTSFWGGWGRG